MENLHKPGVTAQQGEYEEVDSNGKKIQNSRQVTLSNGETLPPTQSSGHKWSKK